MSGGEFLREAEVVERYQIPGKTLRKWRYEGRGPRYMKFGGSVRYRLSDLEVWEREATRGTQSASA